MLPRRVLLCFAAVSIPAMAYCQVPADSTSGLSAVQRDVETLKMQIGDLTRIAQANAVAVGDLTAQMRHLSDRVTKNAEDIQVLADVQQNQAAQFEQIAIRGINGDLRLRFDTKNENARQEFRQAMESTAPTFGTVVINNHMERDQYIMVNGEQHFVLADASLKLQVPVGTVSTRLPGQDIVNWTVGFPEYRQSIGINPKTPSPSVRWIESVPLYVDPIYIDPWGW